MSLAMAVVYDHDYCLHAKCADNADCTEIQFGHNCKCHRGFKGDGVNFCVDIDECSLANRTGLNLGWPIRTFIPGLHVLVGIMVQFWKIPSEGVSQNYENVFDFFCQRLWFQKRPKYCASEHSTCKNGPGWYECNCISPYVGPDNHIIMIHNLWLINYES